MAGYTLHQLLAWCYDDHLIETYAIEGDKVFVQTEGSTQELNGEQAIIFLKALIRATPELPDDPNRKTPNEA